MLDRNYVSVRAYRELAQAVDADPRVVAAKAALDAFNASEAGLALDKATRTRETWAAASADFKDVFEAHSYNYHHARRTVKAELHARRQAERNEA